MGRFPFHHGTIIIAWRRPSDIVVVADSRSRKADDAAAETDAGKTHDKILIHPKLPLLIATTGFANLATEPTEDKTLNPSQTVEVDSLLREYYRTLRYDRHLDIDKMCAELVQMFRPRIADTLTYAETEEQIRLCQVSLAIGFFVNGNPQLTLLEIGLQFRRTDQPGFWTCPDYLIDHREARKPIASRRAHTLNTAEEIADLHAAEIAAAIEAEAKIQPPHLRGCGWPIRAAILPRSGPIRRGTHEEGHSRLSW